jgi:hypothetical protein
MTNSALVAEPPANGGTPRGVVLTTAVYSSLGESDVLPTTDGNWLAVSLPADWDRKADGLAIGLNCMAAVTLDPENTGESNNGFILTLAFTDATGQLWQVAERVNSYSLWEEVFSENRCFDKQTPLDRPNHVMVISERVLFEKLQGDFDGGNQRLLWLRSKNQDYKDGFVQFIFPVHEKTLGYSMSLVERTTVYRNRLPEAPPTHIASLSLSIQFYINSQPVVVLDSANKPLPMKTVNLMDVSPIRCESVHLRPTFRSILYPVRPADAQAWRAALTQAGAQQAQIEKLFAPTKYLVVKNAVQTEQSPSKTTGTSEVAPSGQR